MNCRVEGPTGKEMKGPVQVIREFQTVLLTPILYSCYQVLGYLDQFWYVVSFAAAAATDDLTEMGLLSRTCTNFLYIIIIIICRVNEIVLLALAFCIVVLASPSLK